MNRKNSRIRTALLPVLLPLVLACGSGEAPPATLEEEAGEHAGHAGHAGDTAESHDGEEHAGGEHAQAEGRLAVDPEVLRDLRLTTFPAELRPGGEGVTALGELKVDESAYAEVGAPIAGRIVRLAASPGDFVRRGQPLAELQSVELGQARAGRAAAQARAELARQTVERKRGLAAERIVSRGELQRAEADAAAAEAELRAAEAAVEALGVSRQVAAAAASRASPCCRRSPAPSSNAPRSGARRPIRRGRCSASATCRASGSSPRPPSATPSGCVRARTPRSPWPPCPG